MNTHSRLLIAISALIVFGGCAYGDIYMSPALTARVVDANTGIGIDGVKVTMRSSKFQNINTFGFTERGGYISIPRLSGRPTSGFPFVMDIIVPPAIARFEKYGFELKEISSDIDIDYFNGSRVIELIRAQ